MGDPFGCFKGKCRDDQGAYQARFFGVNRVPKIAALFILAGLSIPCNGLFAQDTTEPVLQALQLSDGADIIMDGQILEEFWGMAVPITDFTQQEPVEGGVPSEKTEVRVVFDQDNLYIGAIIYDDPDGILAYQLERDASLGTDDRFMWILDTFRDGRTGYFFEINAAGLMGDGLMGGGGGGRMGGRGGFGGGSNKAWDGIWEAQTSRRPDGWSAEIRIPFRTLNFDPNTEDWGINFQRTVRRKNEEILWRGWRRTEGLFRPIFAGIVTGLKDMSQGLGLEAKPSGIVSYRNTPADVKSTSYPRDVSLDLDYSITSSLRASFSVNTDFAEVESDNRRVNLTRFSIRYPEKRDFFLEGSGVFSFAPRSSPSPFFSRNIGIKNGQAVPVSYGARTTGQVGAYEVGFYQIGTGSKSWTADEKTNFVPEEQFTVARIKRRVFEQSTIGAIYTRRASEAESDGTILDDRHTAGVDLQLNSRSFLGNNNVEMETFYIWNSNPDPTENHSTDDLSASGVRINFPNDVWSGHLSYRRFGSEYKPALGFVARNDFSRIEPRLGWSPRPASIDWIRKFDFSAQFRNITELGTGVLEEREWSLKPFGVEFESGDRINLDATQKYEYLDRSYQVSDGIYLTEGEYSTWDYRLSGNTAGRRKISLYGGLSFGEFWNGHKVGYGGRVSIKPTPGFTVALNTQVNDVSLPQGDFTANLYEIEGKWQASPWVSTVTQIQYDEQSDLFGLFSRLRWIVKPGNEVYFVYTHNWQNLSASILEDPEFRTLSRGASAKMNYTYRF